jgi:hypothetical protein
MTGIKVFQVCSKILKARSGHSVEGVALLCENKAERSLKWLMGSEVIIIKGM